MGAMKPMHWIVLLVIVLLLFGAKRLPDLAKSVGQSLKIFKKEIKELNDDDTPATPATPPAATPPAATPAAPVDTSHAQPHPGAQAQADTTLPPKV
jgi:sec-independent protein translocase protein TatA